MDTTTPSAFYYPDGHMHCYTCGFHAQDEIDLIRQLFFSQFSHDTGMMLARQHAQSIKLKPSVTPETQPSRELSPEVSAAITLFCQLAVRNLKSDEQFNDVLSQQRGLPDAAALGLGVSEEWMVREVRHKMGVLGFDPLSTNNGLIGAGIIYHNNGNYRLERRVIIPEWRNGRAVYYQGRAIDPWDEPRYKNPPTLKRPLYGVESTVHNGPLWIGEGPFDVLPLIGAGQAAVAPMGSDFGKDTWQELLAIARGRDVIIGFDNDNAGITKAVALQQALAEEDIQSFVKHPVKPYKDYGEWASTVGADIVIAEVLLSL